MAEFYPNFLPKVAEKDQRKCPEEVPYLTVMNSQGKDKI